MIGTTNFTSTVAELARRDTAFAAALRDEAHRLRRDGDADVARQIEAMRGIGRKRRGILGELAKR
jgi:hypothetical protein